MAKRRSLLVTTVPSGAGSNVSTTLNRQQNDTLWKLLSLRYGENPETQRLYRLYTFASDYTSLQCLLVIMIVSTVTVAIANFIYVSHVSVENISSVIFSVIFIVLLVFMHTKYMILGRLIILSCITSAVCLCYAVSSFPFNSHARHDRFYTPADGLWRLAFVTLMIYLFVPLRVYLPLVAGILLALLHSLIAVFEAGSSFPYLLWRQVTVNIIILASVHIVGVLQHRYKMKAERTNFDLMRKSIATQMQLEEEIEKMERLLHCVAPSTIACQIKQEFQALIQPNYFVKFFQRHINVSLMFADVGGFASLTEKCSARDVIDTLNDLINRFDHLTTENQCTRLKLFGDSYLAISGITESEANHAKHCVSLGLDLIDVVSVIREATDIGFKMKVGVHTGTVFGGVFGINSWQYDVTGTDVLIAKQTEKSGTAGRVHITDCTLHSLNGEFDTEIARGRSRNVYPDKMNVETYYVVVDQPRKFYGTPNFNNRPNPGDMTSSLKSIRGLLTRMTSSVKHKLDIPFYNILFTFDTSQRNKRQSLTGLVGPFHARSIGEVSEDRLLKRLHQTITGRTLPQKKDHAQRVTLRFRDHFKEHEFAREADSTFPATVLCNMVLLVLAVAIQAVILPRTLLLLLLFLFSFAWIAIILMLFLGAKLNCIYYDIRKSPYVRIPLLSITVFLIYFTSLTNVFCCKGGVLFPVESTINSDSVIAFNRDYHLMCEMPHYIYLNAILVFLVVIICHKLAAILKLMFLIVIVAGYCFAIEYIDRNLFIYIDEKLRPEVPSDINGIIMMFHFVAGIFISARLYEWVLCLRYLWQEEVDGRNLDLQQRFRINNSLLNHVLPSDIIENILCRSKDSIAECYNRNHRNAGLLYMSLLDYDEYCNRMSVTSDAKQILYVLHEFMSTIDEVADDTRFQCISKVQASGTTILLAAGVNSTFQEEEESSSLSHTRQCLSSLIEFYLIVKDRLKRLNDRLLTSFGLSGSIHVGPAITGIISAKKPQFNIWGPAADVASSMHNHSMSDVLQVTEDVYHHTRTEYQYQFKGGLSVNDSEIGLYVLLTRMITDNKDLPFGNVYANSGSACADTNKSRSNSLSRKELAASKSEKYRLLQSFQSAKVAQIAPITSEILHGSRRSNDPSPNVTNSSQRANSFRAPGGSGSRNAPRISPHTNNCLSNDPIQGKSTAIVEKKVSPLGFSVLKRDSSPDLPIFHYRNTNINQQAAGPRRSVGSNTITLTQPQLSASTVPSVNSFSNPHKTVSGTPGTACQTPSTGRSSSGSIASIKPMKESAVQLDFSDLHRKGSLKSTASPSANPRRSSYLENIAEDLEHYQESQLSKAANKDILKENNAAMATCFPFISVSGSSAIAEMLFGDGSADSKPKRSFSLKQTADDNQRPCEYHNNDFRPPVKIKAVPVKNAPMISLNQQSQKQTGGSNGSKLAPIGEGRPKQQQQQQTKATETAIVKPNENRRKLDLHNNEDPDDSVTTEDSEFGESPPPLPPPPQVELLKRRYIENNQLLNNGKGLNYSKKLSAFRPVRRPNGPAASNQNTRSASFCVPYPINPLQLNAARQQLSKMYDSKHVFTAAKQNLPYNPDIRDTDKYNKNYAPPFQVKRRQHLRVKPRLCKSLEYIPSDLEDCTSCSSRADSPVGSRAPLPKVFQHPFSMQPTAGLLVPDNISLSSFEGSELSRSDPALNYESGSGTYESEYDNYKPGMTSDEDYFASEPISDMDIDIFDDVTVDDVKVGDPYNYLPLIQKMITDV